jgi:hypothetical protein
MVFVPPVLVNLPGKSAEVDDIAGLQERHVLVSFVVVRAFRYVKEIRVEWERLRTTAREGRKAEGRVIFKGIYLAGMPGHAGNQVSGTGGLLR